MKSKKTFFVIPRQQVPNMGTEEQELDDDSTGYRPRHIRQAASKSFITATALLPLLLFVYKNIKMYTRGRQKGGIWMKLNSHKRERLSTELVQHPRKSKQATQRKREERKRKQK